MKRKLPTLFIQKNILVNLLTFFMIPIIYICSLNLWCLFSFQHSVASQYICSFLYISDINNSTRVTLSIYLNWNLLSVWSDIREYLPNSRVMSAIISVDGVPIYSLGQYRVQALFFPRIVSNIVIRKNRVYLFILWFDDLVSFLLFNATFGSISAILWR